MEQERECVDQEQERTDEERELHVKAEKGHGLPRRLRGRSGRTGRTTKAGRSGRADGQTRQPAQAGEDREAISASATSFAQGGQSWQLLSRFHVRTLTDEDAAFLRRAPTRAEGRHGGFGELPWESTAHCCFRSSSGLHVQMKSERSNGQWEHSVREAIQIRHTGLLLS